MCLYNMEYQQKPEMHKESTGEERGLGGKYQDTTDLKWEMNKKWRGALTEEAVSTEEGKKPHFVHLEMPV